VSQRGLLDGVRILDLSHMLAGPYGSMLMGDLSAEVIKIEPPSGGDPMRHMGPHFLAGESAYYLSINRNKQSVTVDLQNECGRQVFYDLVRASDVVFDNFRPGVLERMKCDYATLRSINPQIICCSISGFGQTGPYRDQPAFDLVLQALSGAMSITGEPGGAPTRMGIPMGDLAGGLFGAIAVSAALYQREQTGEGCRVEMGLLDCMISLLTYVAQYYFHTGVPPQPIGTAHQSVVPYQAFQAQDGWLVVAVFTERFWEGFCRALELPELIQDPRFTSNDARREHRAELIPILAERFNSRPVAEWLRCLEKEKVPSGPLNSLDRVFADPQVLAREMKTSVVHPTIGELPILGNPIKVDGHLDSFIPPPRLGEHTIDVLKNILGYSPEKIAQLKQQGVI
jgi:crotonobetainyl-CoA:carnitine CoA-transferase CaiB-like acyl-CoA transferase